MGLQGLKTFTPGRPPSASALNEMVLRIGGQNSGGMPAGAVDRFGAASRLSLGNAGWWGVIMSAGPASEADYTDARYWVKTACINPAAAGTNTGLIEADVIEDARAVGTECVQWLTATNLSEIAADTHVAPYGTPVFIRRFYGRDSDAPYYVFSSDQPEIDVLTVDALAVNATPALVNITPLSGTLASTSTDGVSLATGDYLFLISQTTPAQNGVYIYNSVDAWIFLGQPYKITVIGGTLNASTEWLKTAANTYTCQNPTVTLGSTPISTGSGSPSPATAAGQLCGTDQNGVARAAYLPEILTGLSGSYIWGTTQTRTITSPAETDTMTPKFSASDKVRCFTAAGGILYGNPDGRFWASN